MYGYSTVTELAKFLGQSASTPFYRSGLSKELHSNAIYDRRDKTINIW
nr:hypothetical protein [Wolbachia endosymbiont of Atemnus politus]